jgi:2-O-(6-phospho-alpha-D-mannosyl)-D-glycerate hydrolase
MKCFLVSHTHWDREWYRTFEAFRARLVDAIDCVLAQVAADPGFRFLLDGQTIVLEDYLAVRPERRADLGRACRSGRVAIGPWYVQPDSLLPGGETHVRNLLEGRRVGARFGSVSTVAYTPDSFGHPAQLPQLFCGFGLEPFVYWRGNGDEIDALPAEYLWEAPDGSAVLAHHLSEGYFAAANLGSDANGAVRPLRELAEKLASRSRNDAVVLMNGIDHALPDESTGPIAQALEAATGWTVRRGLLEDFAAELSRHAPRFRGELLGGRVANLLPGVWSTRLGLKLRNRLCETVLLRWLEPWAALGRCLGAPDESPSVRLAWRALLQNQAHDSICGCSQDRVHEQMQTRYDTAEELAAETARRLLERLAGMGTGRATPWDDEVDVAVFNPSPHSRTDVVRFPLDPSSWLEIRGAPARGMAIHPLLLANVRAGGFTVDGEPAALVAGDATRRVGLIPERPPLSVEFVAEDVPAFGWRRFRLRPAEERPDQVDDGVEIADGGRTVRVDRDGTLAVTFGNRVYEGLCGLEDTGDRGDTYDYDAVPGEPLAVDGVEVVRRARANGVRLLSVRRTMLVPCEIDAGRERRADRRVPLTVDSEVRLVPGLERVDLTVRVDNTARDHRLRLLFPTGAPAAEFLAATTFDVARRRPEPSDANRWVHPSPRTFPHQGFVSVNGLTLAAPGLPEAEVLPDGTIALTLVRAVGWLSRMDLHSRPQMAGPSLPTPGAQCPGAIEARLSLHAGLDIRSIDDAEWGLKAVVAGERPLFPPGTSLVRVTPAEVVLSALKPAQDGPGMILRLLNPTDTPMEASVHLGLPFERAFPVRLDETPLDPTFDLEAGELRVHLPPHALRSVLIR